MTCPDIDSLLSDSGAWASHVDACPSCQAFVRSSQAVVDALVAPVAPNPRLAERTAQSVRRTAEADRRRSFAGIAATFTLALVTLGAIALLASAASGASAGRMLFIAACVVAGAAVATVVEPHMTEG